MKQLIAGFGFVGRAVKELFPNAIKYDIKDDHVKCLDVYPSEHFDFCHVCVPTPMKEDGSCDTSAVEDVISKIDADVFIIRSTIPPGTCDKIERKHMTGIPDFPNKEVSTVTYEKNLVHQPEYVASSSPYPSPLGDMKARTFVILGGQPENTKKVRRLYETIYPPTTRIIEMSAKEAEVTKYMENSFIATYVTFCNEFYYICEKYDIDFDNVREGFLADPRMPAWWTYCKGDGWGGECLPKDLSSITYETKSQFLQAVIDNNKRHQQTLEQQDLLHIQMNRGNYKEGEK